MQTSLQTSARAADRPGPNDAPRQGYLDPAVTGSRWLFDPDRMSMGLHTQFEPGAVVDARAAARDLRAFGDLLRDAYARYDAYAQAGVDVSAAAERAAQRVEQLDQPSAADAFGPLLRELRQAVPDNHLRIRIPELGALDTDPELQVREFRGDARQLRAAAAVPGALAATAQSVPVLNGTGLAGAVGTVSAIGTNAAQQLAKLGFAAQSERVPDADLAPVATEPYSFRRVGTTGIITLPQFDRSEPETRAGLEQFVADVAKHRECENLILDLRGNGGGSVLPVYEWAQAMRAKTTTLHPLDSSDGSTSGRQWAVKAWNNGAFYGEFEPGQPFTEAWQTEAAKTKRQWPLAAVMPSLPSYPDGDQHGTADTDWHGNVAVLVDRRNASSGELAPMYLRDWLGAQVVGERTGGYLEGLDIMPYQLPETGVSVFVPSSWAKWGDQRVKEGAGIPIDIALDDPAMSADDVARAMFAPT